jgi:5-methylcytosine-specific restriction endonuclease McrA
MAKPKVLHNFYKSPAWKLARNIKINNANGKCERCAAIGEEVHHKIRLTVLNVHEAIISVKQDNLELLCKKCHNEEHGRLKENNVLFDEDGNFSGYMIQ